jgi:sugar phosphate isomerase/epimerase
MNANMFGQTSLSRREYLRLMATASLTAAPQTHVTGVQLYAVRAALKRDPDRTLQAVAGIGFKEVEGFSRPETVALAPKIKQYGLTLRSCQIETPLLTGNWDQYPDLKQVTLPEAIDSLAAAGAGYFTLGYISPGARGDNDDFFRRTADRMNAAAELGRKSTLRSPGRTTRSNSKVNRANVPSTYIKERLDQKLVGLELNVFWAAVAGQDPLRLMKEWKGRVPLLQLNDKAKGTPHQFSENLGVGAFVEAGGGDIDFPAVLKAAAAASVKAQFIGQDETLGDSIENLRHSFAYLNR